MSTIFPVVSETVAMIIEWMGDFLTAITSEPILTFFCIVLPICGIGIGILRRLLRVRA